MSSYLDDLFAEIINSERIAHEKKSRLNEVRHAINEAENKILEETKIQESLDEEIAKKIEILNEEKLNLKWLQRKEQIFMDQKHTLEQEKKDYLEQMESLDTQLDQKNSKFCSSVERFLCDFGLMGTGHNERKERAKARLEELEEEEKVLSKDAEQFKIHKDSIENLQQEEKQLRYQFGKIVQQNADKAEELENERRLLQEKECEKEVVIKFPSTDPEFVRLHKELDESKCLNLEEKCLNLEHQLQKLQQQMWQKQVRQRQQQQRQKYQQQKIASNTQENTKQTSDQKISTANRVCFSNFKASDGGDGSSKQDSLYLKTDLEDIFVDDMNTISDVSPGNKL